MRNVIAIKEFKVRCYGCDVKLYLRHIKQSGRYYCDICEKEMLDHAMECAPKGIPGYLSW